MLEKFKDIIVEYVDVEKDDITEESRFVEDLGFNSYEFMSVFGEIEEEFDIEIDENDITDIITVKDAMDYVEKKQND